jgi:hypothetical protein
MIRAVRVKGTSAVCVAGLRDHTDGQDGHSTDFLDDDACVTNWAAITPRGERR